MITKPIACKLYEKLAAAPAGWFHTSDGKRLVRKSLALVKKEEGKEEAKALGDMLALRGVFMEEPVKRLYDVLLACAIFESSK